MKNMRSLRLSSDNRGVAAVEMAIILPVLILIIIGVLVYGIYFVKFGLVSRSVSTTATAIQLNPNDASLNGLAHSSGAVLVNYDSPNYICAMSYTTQAAAQSGKCAGTSWTTSAPAGVNVGTPYYVAVAAFVKKSPLVPLLSDLIPDIRASSIVQVRNSPAPPLCLGVNKMLQYDNFSYSCADVKVPNPPTPPNCNGANQVLQYSGGAYSCATINTNSGSGAGAPGAAGADAPKPPVCTDPGKALQFNGTNYTCVTSLASGQCYLAKNNICSAGYSMLRINGNQYGNEARAQMIGQQGNNVSADSNRVCCAD